MEIIDYLSSVKDEFGYQLDLVPLEQAKVSSGKERIGEIKRGPPEER